MPYPMLNHRMMVSLLLLMLRMIVTKIQGLTEELVQVIFDTAPK